MQISGPLYNYSLPLFLNPVDVGEVVDKPVSYDEETTIVMYFTAGNYFLIHYFKL